MKKNKLAEMDAEGTSIKSQRTITRSISLPIAECLSHTWPEFMKLLHNCWRNSTDLANWARHTLVRLDVTRTPGMKELPPMPTIDLYANAFGREKERPAKKEGKGTLPVVPQEYDAAEFWCGGKIAAASLLRKVHRKYSKERSKIIWRRERRAPEFLYPFPFPVHQQSWVVSFTETKQPILNFALPGGRVSVRLRCGAEFVRQIRILQMIADGDIAQQELSICRQRSYVNSGTGHYRANTQRDSGSQKVSYRVMVRISCKVPVGPENKSEVVASVRTGNSPFLLLAIADQEPWLFHAEHVRQWIVAHRSRLDRMSDDMKYEKRWPKRKRRRMLHRVQRGCDKHANRMKTFLQQTACMLVGHAQRRGCGRLQWDDSDRSFIDRDFPWFQLREVVKNKCDEVGLNFALVASGDVIGTETPDNNGVNNDSV